MELIKQIKDAEKQAKDIVEKARQDSASLLEEAKKQRDDLLKQSQQRRIESIAPPSIKPSRTARHRPTKLHKPAPKRFLP
jgi:vacuolar-type H+-ATPase subunit H